MLRTEQQEFAGYERRMDQIAVNIEKMRADMRWEAKKFAVSAVLAAAALVGAGLAIGSYFTRSTPQTINVHLDQPLVPSPAHK